MGQSELLMQLCVISLFMWASDGFYIPGVAPTEYKKGDKLDIRVSDSKKKKKWFSCYIPLRAHPDNFLLLRNSFSFIGCEDD